MFYPFIWKNLKLETREKEEALKRVMQTQPFQTGEHHLHTLLRLSKEALKIELIERGRMCVGG